MTLIEFADIPTNSVFIGLVALLLVIGFYVALKPRKNGKEIARVKGGLPFFGQVFEMLRGTPWDLMEKWMHQYGPIYTFHLFGSDAVCVSDPDLLRVVLQTKMGIFKKDVDWTYNPFLVVLGNGLVTAHGKSWMKQRALLSSHLRIDILELIPEMAMRAVERLCCHLDKAKNSGTIVDIDEEFRQLTLQVISEAVLSISPQESNDVFAKMYLPIMEEGNLRVWGPHRKYLPTPSWFKFQSDVNTLNSYVMGLINKRWALRQQEASVLLQSGTPSTRKLDVLDKTLSAIPVDEWCVEAATQIRDEVKTFILAGHETSASMLTWTLFELTKNPDCLARVQAEAKEAYACGMDLKTGRVSSLPSRLFLDDKLRFTDCCLKESLRKYSIVPTVVRMASESTDVGEYHITKGTSVMINMQGVHHNPKIWPEPMSYKPERFLHNVPQPFTFLPFIEGPRNCLGQFLALLESKVLISMLVSTYRFEIVNEDAGERHSFMVPITPKSGHKVKIHSVY